MANHTKDGSGQGGGANPPSLECVCLREGGGEVAHTAGFLCLAALPPGMVSSPQLGKCNPDPKKKNVIVN